MQSFEINDFLSGNQWVSDAVVSSAGDDAGPDLIRLDVSTAGHRLICKQGLEKFSEEIHQRLPSKFAREAYWHIQAVNDRVFEGHDTVSHFKLPRLLSWINEAPRHALLLEVSPDLSVFEGHFPDNPILPGIVQLHWAVGVSMGIFRFSDAPFEIKRLKFKNIVQPPRILELVLTRTSANEVGFQFSSTDQVHSMGCFVMEEELPC